MKIAAATHVIGHSSLHRYAKMHLAVFTSVAVATRPPCLGAQMERLRVGTIVDPDPFLNNGSSSGSGFDSELVLFVPNPVPIGKPGSGSGTGST